MKLNLNVVVVERVKTDQGTPMFAVTFEPVLLTREEWAAFVALEDNHKVVARLGGAE